MHLNDGETQTENKPPKGQRDIVEHSDSRKSPGGHDLNIQTSKTLGWCLEFNGIQPEKQIQSLQGNKPDMVEKTKSLTNAF